MRQYLHRRKRGLPSVIATASGVCLIALDLLDTLVSMRVGFIRLFHRIIDGADYAIASVRLRILDRIAGPEPPTLADRQREADHERLQRAFPKVDIDRRTPKR